MDTQDKQDNNKDLISTAFNEFLQKLHGADLLTDEVINILRLTFFSGAITVFSELLPVDKITSLHTEIGKFANDPSGHGKTN